MKTTRLEFLKQIGATIFCVGALGRRRTLGTVPPSISPVAEPFYQAELTPQQRAILQAFNADTYIPNRIPQNLMRSNSIHRAYGPEF
jgi:hypothetical protein